MITRGAGEDQHEQRVRMRAFSPASETDGELRGRDQLGALHLQYNRSVRVDPHVRYVVL